MTALALCLAITAIHPNLDTQKKSLVCENAQYIIEASEKYKLDPLIFSALIWKESRWTPKAISKANACGLTQVLPKYVPETCKELKTPKISIETGARVLSYWIVKRKKKKIETALACYNAGNKCLDSKGGKAYAKSVLRLSRKYKRWIKINYKPTEEQLKMINPPHYDWWNKQTQFANN